MNVAQIKSGQDITELPEPLIHVAVVIPAYRVEDHLAEVIAQVPHLVQTIIAVDDGSPDGTGQLLDQLARRDRRLVVIHHETNRGVGGATKSGYLEALRRGAGVVVKLDGDGQMNPEYIESLADPILAGQAEYVKGNRFQDWSYLRTMPLGRKIGNLGLSFLIKLTSGYWNVFDPTNGSPRSQQRRLDNLISRSWKTGIFSKAACWSSYTGTLHELNKFRCRPRTTARLARSVYGNRWWSSLYT